MPLASIYFPANAQFFNFLLRDIVTFDLIPTEFIVDMFDYSDTDTLPNYNEMDIFLKLEYLLNYY